MNLEEQIRQGIEENKKELDKFCMKQNEEREQELNKILESLKQQLAQQIIDLDPSKIKLPKYPMYYDCPFENKEE